MYRSTKQSLSQDSPPPYEWPLLTTATSSLKLPRNDKEYSYLLWRYHDAQKKVVDWLIQASQHQGHTDVSYYVKVARQAWKKGSDMPPEIKTELEDTIQGRKLCRDHLRLKNVDGQTHDCPIATFEAVKEVFSRPASMNLPQPSRNLEGSWRRNSAPPSWQRSLSPKKHKLLPESGRQRHKSMAGIGDERFKEIMSRGDWRGQR